MKDQLKAIREQAFETLQEVREAKDLDQIKVRFLGKKGELTAIMKEMGKLSAEERPIIGQLANQVRQEIEQHIEQTKKELAAMRGVCDEYGLFLYIDGARLGCALTCRENDTCNFIQFQGVCGRLF